MELQLGVLRNSLRTEEKVYMPGEEATTYVSPLLQEYANCGEYMKTEFLWCRLEFLFLLDLKRFKEVASMATKWIVGAIRHPGALRRSLHVKAGKNIPKGKLQKAAKKGGVLGRRARLALTLSKMRKKG